MKNPKIIWQKIYLECITEHFIAKLSNIAMFFITFSLLCNKMDYWLYLWGITNVQVYDSYLYQVQINNFVDFGDVELGLENFIDNK